MEGYHSPQVAVDVRLNTNESPFEPPAELTERLADELRSIAWHRYPDRAATTLRGRIAALHGVIADQVFAANGSNEVLQTLLLAYAGPGRRVATFEPTYALHGHIARITGAEVVEGERGDDFVLGEGEVHRVLDRYRPAVAFLCSPNNPTGLVEPANLVRAVAERATADGFVLVVDEAYGQFAPWSALELFDEDTPLVVTRTYSKTWSMAAARLGYLVGPTWLVAELHKVVLPYHLDVVTQLAGTLALDYTDQMTERVSLVVEERGRLQAVLGELPVTTWPSAANFLLFRPERRGGDDVWRALVDRSVLVRNCSSWPRLEGCLRVTVGTPDENDAFLAALTEVLA
jgi:histidinol-phosphate aminotransferase